jgi:hypothetical protein
LSTIACPFVPFPLAFVLSVFLRLTTSGYFFGFLRPSGPGGSSNKAYQLLAHGFFGFLRPSGPGGSSNKAYQLLAHGFFGFLRPSGPGGSSNKAYQLLAHGRWFSPVIPASSTTKTGRHDIAEILLKVALSTKIQILRFYSQTRNILDKICVTI